MGLSEEAAHPRLPLLFLVIHPPRCCRPPPPAHPAALPPPAAARRSKLSTASETIEQWLTVQNMWMYMEAVFSGGDIVKQLPQEAKRFQNIDKNFMKARARAGVGWLGAATVMSGLLRAVAGCSTCRVRTPLLLLLRSLPLCWLYCWPPASAPASPASAARPLQVVAHASETVNVVDTCVGTELLRSMLPHLLEQLELTQKSLSAYLGA